MALPVDRMSRRSYAMNTPLPEPATVAERTDYRETSRHSDVLAFVRDLQQRMPFLRVESMGKSGLGQEMPVLILTRAKPDAPVPVVLVIANIHAGEVEGKEAALMLARDLGASDPEGLLNRMTLLVIPDYNPDGNDAISTENRKLDLKNLEGQIGPEGGVGTRYTGEGINLNRDFMKLEAVESRNLAALFAKWRPHVTIDLHATDGSLHRFALTYDTAHNPASGPHGPIRYVRDRLLPAVSDVVRRGHGFDTFFYGNFRVENDPEQGWQTYPPLPRYGSHYRGLTGRMDILSEAYSYIPFRTRCDVTRAFLREIFRYVASHGDEIRRIVEENEQDIVSRGRDPSPLDRIGIRYGLPQYTDQGLSFRYPAAPRPGECTILSWDRDSLRERRLEGALTADYRTRHYSEFEPSKRVVRPFAYSLPASEAKVLEKLRHHRIGVERLTAEIGTETEVAVIRKIETSPSRDAGNAPRIETVVAADPRREGRKLPAGSLLVRTAQPLGNVAIYLLEAESDDGLVRWNVFDDRLQPGFEYPVLRIPSRQDLPSEPLP